MKGNPVNWFEIYTEDFDRAKKFYSTVFQIELKDMEQSANMSSHMEMKYAYFPGDMNAWGASGALAKIDMAKPGMGGTVVYFSTEDVTAEQNRVEAAGGKVIRPKFAIGQFGFIALVQDSEGNMIGLHSMK